MSFESLVQIDTERPRKHGKKNPPVKKDRGCEGCPANKKHVKKILGKVKGKEIFIVCQNPGPDENEEGKELVGPSGEWLWKELKKVGIRRKDCDIQNVVRCFTHDGWDDDAERYRMRAPNKEEIHHCSIYTEKAIEKSKAKIYLVFGQIAGKAMFGNEFKKDKRMFWSDKLQAKVYCLDHPSYFLRGAPQNRLEEFRASLESAAQDFKGKKAVSRYAYVESQDYKGIFTEKEAKKEARKIRRAGRRGIRVSVDIEDDKIDGERTVLVTGFCFKPGRSRIFFCDPRYHGNKKVAKVVKDLLKDPKIPKVMQHGSYDAKRIKQLWGVDIANYHYDTQYAEFMAFPGRYSYALATIANDRFQVFSDYKTIVMPEAIPKIDKHSENLLPKNLEKAPLVKQYEWYSKRGLLSFRQLPKHKMIWYNGADCDITKRIELTTKDKVSLPLLSIYVDCAFVLDEMEANGPWFDEEHFKKLERLYPPKLAAVERKIKQIAGDKDFNPASPPQVFKVMYEKLKLPYPFKLEKGEKKNTRKQTLEVLARKYEFPKLLIQWRKLSKIVSTYLGSYAECAKINKGRLRTKWWLTGTRTGRLSSGGNKDETNFTVVNLQNVHGDPNLQNQLVPDKEWRKLFDAVEKKIRKKLYEKIGSDVLKKIYKLVCKIQACENTKKKEKLLAKQFKYVELIRTVLKNVSFDDILKKYGDFKVILGYDFGQIEVRVMAQIAGDKKLIADCKAGDIHSRVGHAMTGWPVEQIKKDKKTRTLTKNIHFGMLFGLSKNGVYSFIKIKDPDANITEEQCEQMYDNYFKRYKGVARFTKEIREFVADNGYVENIFGFRRPLNTADIPDDDELAAFSDDSGGQHAYWGNQALNTPVQGSAHHLMLMALRMFKHKPKKYKKLLGVPPMEVHDALKFFVKLKDLLKCIPLGHELLEKEPLRTVKKKFPKVKWKVPLEVEPEVGFRLGDVVEMPKGASIGYMLTEMFISTYLRECALDTELKAA